MEVLDASVSEDQNDDLREKGLFTFYTPLLSPISYVLNMRFYFYIPITVTKYLDDDSYIYKYIISNISISGF